MASVRSTSAVSLLVFSAIPVTAVGVAAARGAQAGPAAVSDVVYDVTFDAPLAASRTVHVTMTFSVAVPGEVVLSLPAWTPGAYEISNFARNVSGFGAQLAGEAVEWDRFDHDSWRVRVPSAGTVEVSFQFLADTLDNAMAWAQPDFLMLNGTNVFPWPEGMELDFTATVRVHTERDWLVATGMDAGPKPGTWQATNYHELVDRPWFIGRFDLDSMNIDGRLNRLATYPTGAMTGAARQAFWQQLKQMMPVQADVFGETPWEAYTTMIIFDDAYPGASALEHGNSHVGIYNTGMVGNLVLPLITAHEIFHAWNVKRLRPAGMVPYRYDTEQPTPWLWVSEGITDYYADLTLVRSGIAPEPAFFAITTRKINSIGELPPVALEDASVSTWVRPRDGTGYSYYDKGSLAGLLLDILIRDASGNGASLDDVMRKVYMSTYGQGRGFTGEDWWSAVSQAANGRSFADFRARYVDGREPFPWETVLPLAGMKFIADTVREPRIGVELSEQPDGVYVQTVLAGSMAAEAGIRPGDRLVSIGGIEVDDLGFGYHYREQYGDAAAGTPLPIVVDRNSELLTIEGRLRFRNRIEARIEPDPAASGRAVRIRDGILKGRSGSR